MSVSGEILFPFPLLYAKAVTESIDDLPMNKTDLRHLILFQTCGFHTFRY